MSQRNNVWLTMQFKWVVVGEYTIIIKEIRDQELKEKAEGT